NHARKLLVRFYCVHNHMNCRFFVCHSKKHIVPCSILKTKKFVLNCVISSRKFPKFPWHNNRKKNFLSANFVHFFANYCLNFLTNSLCWWKQRKNTRTYLFYV